jgi:hypothetical protein
MGITKPTGRGYMAKVKEQEYMVGMFIKLWLDVPIKATTFDAAVEKSKTITLEDCVTIKAGRSYNDYGFKVVQVYDPDFDTSMG